MNNEYNKVDKIESPKFQGLSTLNKFKFRELEDVPCNICNKDSNLKDLFREGVFRIKKCLCCNLLFVTPQPSQEELDKYYEFFFSGAEEENPERWDNTKSFNQIISILEKQVSKEHSILDIGSGYGFFIKKAIAKGFQDITGVEPDNETSIVCREKNPSAKIINESFTNINFDESRYDVILLLASLEHFKNPLAVLKKCHELLTKDGLILIRVPYLEGYFKLNSIVGRNIFPFGAPRHLYDFSPEALGLMLKHAGFIVKDILPGDQEKTSSTVYDLFVKLVKCITWALWILSNKKFIHSFSGSIVVLGQKNSLPLKSNKGKYASAPSADNPMV